jgi:hypothetical protein
MELRRDFKNGTSMGVYTNYTIPANKYWYLPIIRVRRYFYDGPHKEIFLLIF